jgi:hypothetical protein
LHLVGVPYYFTYNDDARSDTYQVYSSPCSTTDAPTVVAPLIVTLEQSISYCPLSRQATVVYVTSSIMLGIEKVLKLEKIKNVEL